MGDSGAPGARLDVVVRRAAQVASSLVAGYLDAEAIVTLERDGVVGDVNTVLLREDGTYADLELNRRATGSTRRRCAACRAGCAWWPIRCGRGRCWAPCAPG